MNAEKRTFLSQEAKMQKQALHMHSRRYNYGSGTDLRAGSESWIKEWEKKCRKNNNCTGRRER